MWSPIRSLLVVTTLLATSCVAVRDIKEERLSDLTLDPTRDARDFEEVNGGTRILLQEGLVSEAAQGPAEAATSAGAEPAAQASVSEPKPEGFKYTVADACIADVSVFDETAKPHFVHSDYTAAVRCCALDGSLCHTKSRGEGECLPADVTFEHAKQTCTDIGWRLPKNIEELGSACGTGCLFDYKEIWYDDTQEGVTEFRSPKQLAHQAKRVLLYGDTLRVGSFMTDVRNAITNTSARKSFTPNRAPFYVETFAHKLQRQLNAWGLTACGAKVDFGGMPAFPVSQIMAHQTSEEAKCIYKPQVHANNMQTVCPGLMSLMRKSHSAGAPYGYVMIMIGQADIQAGNSRVSIGEILRDIRLLHTEVWNEGAKSFIMTLPKFPEVESFTEEQAKLVHEFRIKVNHALTQLAQESDGKGILLDIDRLMDDLRSDEKFHSNFKYFTNDELNLDGYQRIAELVSDLMATSGENINPCGRSTKTESKGFFASLG